MSRRKPSWKKRILLALAALAAVAGALAFLRRGDEAVEVTVKAVKRGDITSVVTATGRIQPKVEVVISSEVPGEIVELPVRDGDRVEKGQLLVRVNPDTLEAQVKQQEAGLAASRAESARQRAEMLKAELDFKRSTELAGKGFATRDELDQARTRLEMARAAHEASLHQIERQEMQLREARDQLAKASIFSPIAGTVVRLDSEIGDRVVGTGQFEGTEIMRVADLSAMEAEVEVSEADIVKVGIGDAATVEVDALPDEPVPGAVTEIANSALTTDPRNQEQQTTFTVRIDLEKLDARLRPGMTATAEIETDTVREVVKAPLGSVVVRPRKEVEALENGGGPDDGDGGAEAGEAGAEGRGKDGRVRVVFLEDGDRARLRRVETGIADRDFIEIVDGLAEGERIITGSYRALTRELQDGSRITTEGKKGGRE
jgi:HlyD family secretion protein